MNSKSSRRLLSSELHEVARRRLAFLAAAESLEDLPSRPGLNLHPLQRERIGQYAIRINDQFRICFIWRGDEAHEVEITDYH